MVIVPTAGPWTRHECGDPQRCPQQLCEILRPAPAGNAAAAVSVNYASNLRFAWRRPHAAPPPGRDGDSTELRI